MTDGGRDPTLALAMRRHTWQRFEEIALQAARHLPLTAWEVNFLLSLAEAKTLTQGGMELSDKQLTVLLRLEDRVKVQQILDRAHRHPQRLSAWEKGKRCRGSTLRGVRKIGPPVVPKEGRQRDGSGIGI
jgi:hypothetical protein